MTIRQDKVPTGVQAPGDDEIMEAPTRTLDEAPGFGRAVRPLLLRADDQVN